VPRLTPATSLALACDQLADEWTTDAAKRRRITARDIAADTLEYAAQQLREAVAQHAAGDTPLSVAEYAALHQVPEPTVRRWCANGAIRASKKGRGWVIRRDEPTPQFGAEAEVASAA